MNSENLYHNSQAYLKMLCETIPERCVGSPGNRLATRFFEREIASFGWETEAREFDAIDWINGGATLQAGGQNFAVLVSPYSPGCAVRGQLVAVATMVELEQAAAKDKVILLHGEIAKEQLMPKNFVFFNPEEHQKVVALLEKSGVQAIIGATGRNGALSGGVYPFPLIEDGDFTIPSVYMTEEEGKRLLPFVGTTVDLASISELVTGKGYNVVARIGPRAARRIVITAHIDAKKGTPGAIDNATGVIVLLLVADLLRNYSGSQAIEIVAFNGEDYYAVPGQMDYLRANQDKFAEILLNINSDGAGYLKGKSAFSFFSLPPDIENAARSVVDQYTGITEGTPWVQGDHSIFIQQGRPAIAVTSQWFLENIDEQTVTHTPQDNPAIVDCHKLVEIAEAIRSLIMRLG